MAVTDGNPKYLRCCRFITLLALCLIDGTYTVLRRYSRGVLNEQYAVNEVLLLSEVYKLLFSICMLRSNINSELETNKTRNRSLSTHLLDLLVKSRRMMVLAIIYGVGNILSYYALARIGAGTFVVIAQGKTLTTALFSSLMMGRIYSWTQWRALITLVAGVILFVLPTFEQENGLTTNTTDTDAITSAADNKILMGCLIEAIVILLSGFASIYFEKSMKSAAESEGLDIWARNFQLAFHSIFIYAILIVTYPSEDNLYFFQWTPLAFTLSILGASGGLLVALSIKYGDSVLKTLAISGSILYAAALDKFALGGPLTGQMGISAIVVIMAIISYTFDATPDPSAATEASKGSQIPVIEPKGSEDANDSQSLEEGSWADNESLQVDNEPLVDQNSSLLERRRKGPGVQSSTTQGDNAPSTFPRKRGDGDNKNEIRPSPYTLLGIYVYNKVANLV